MDATFQYPDKNEVKQTEASRKRLNVSGRLSPRALFGNLKIKKPLLNEENTKLKDMPNYKTGFGWKPPLKVELNDSDSAGPSYHDHNSVMIGNCYQNCDSNSLPKEQPLNINRPNYLDCNKSFCLNEDIKIEGQGEFTENLDETVNYEEYSNPRAMSQGEYLESLSPKDSESPKESISHDLSFNDSINDEISQNISKKQFHDVPKVDFECVDENKIDMSQPLIEKQSLLYVNDAVLMNYGLQFSNNSLKEFIDKSIHESVDSHTKNECGVLDQENFKDHKQTKGVKNEEYLEKRDDSPKSTAELNNNSKTPLMEQNYMEYKDETKEEIFGENVLTQIKVSYGTPQKKNMVDDSFDSSITNSQFLQLESHVEKMSNNIELLESNSAQLNSSIESINRCSSSLVVQTDWQKNILRSMIKDIEELNKTVVNATALLKLTQRGNFPTKQ